MMVESSASCERNMHVPLSPVLFVNSQSSMCTVPKLMIPEPSFSYFPFMNRIFLNVMSVACLTLNILPSPLASSVAFFDLDSPRNFKPPLST